GGGGGGRASHRAGRAARGPRPAAMAGGGAESAAGPGGGALPATEWPAHFRAIPRITFSSMDEMIETMKEQAARAEPLVVEGAGIIGTERWADVEGHLGGLLGDRAVLVKRSPSQRFRYFDLKKNTGRYDFKQPLREEQMCLRDFLAESRFILEEGRAERMYLQETLSGHAEMAEEFASWRWELLIRVSSACGCP
ncbi:unnamed protein product, partial [Prorocentrum cordatum]